MDGYSRAYVCASVAILFSSGMLVVISVSSINTLKSMTDTGLIFGLVVFGMKLVQDLIVYRILRASKTANQ